MPTTSTWEGRKNHDTLSREALKKATHDLGWKHRKIDKYIRLLLHRALGDKVTGFLELLVRHFPDDILSWQGYECLCNVKSEAQGYPNFAVEALSYTIAWFISEELEEPVVLAFVDMSTWLPYDIKCCFVKDLPTPNKISVPTHHHLAPQYMTILHDIFPNTTIDPTHSGGSGTPYFLVPKNDPCLVNLEPFLANIKRNQHLNTS